MKLEKTLNRNTEKNPQEMYLNCFIPFLENVLIDHLSVHAKKHKIHPPEADKKQLF